MGAWSAQWAGVIGCSCTREQAACRSILPRFPRVRSAISVPDMDANGNHPAEWLLFGLFSGEARCLGQTWKRMKMEPNWGILEGGEPARRDRGVLVPRTRR